MKTDKHKFRLCWLFMGVGLLGVIFSWFVLPVVLDLLTEVDKAMNEQSWLAKSVIIAISLSSILMLVSGYAYAKNIKYSKQVMFVSAVFLVFSFPIGSLIAAYYFWYEFSFKQQNSS